MELPKNLDDFIKDSIDHTLGLPVSESSLQLQLQSLETSNHILRSQVSSAQSRLTQKQAAIDLAKEEASKNAQSLKSSVEEARKLGEEFSSVQEKHKILAGECVRMYQEQNAVMNLAKQAQERLKVAEIRAHELEEKLKHSDEQLQLHKRLCQMFSVDSSRERKSSEHDLVNELLARLVSETEVAKTAQAFLERNNAEIEDCFELLIMFDSLRPETKNVLGLAARQQSLQKDKEQLRINLQNAEEEVRVLFEDNKILDEEKNRLLKLCDPNMEISSSGEEQSSDSTNKSKKTKASS